MRAHRPRCVAALAAAAWLLTTSSGAALGQSAGDPTDEFVFSEGFSDVQGANQWSYLEHDGAGYRPMRWDPEIGRWRGSGEFSQIWGDGIHPGEAEAVISWRAPRAGTVHIRGMIERPDRNGDGVRARVVKDGATIWPADGAQEVDPLFTAQHSLMAEVEAGDRIHFHLGPGRTTFFDTTRWDPVIRYDATPAFLLGEARVVARPEDLDRLGIVTLDSSLSLVGHLPDGRHVWSHSLGNPEEPRGATHHRMVGGLDRPIGELIAAKDEGQFFVANPSGADGKWWLTNVYRHDDGAMLGFIHVEQSGASGQKYRLGLAVSGDSGASWVYLGHIIQQQGDPDGLNIMGSPYLIIDGSFYLYYRDAAGACVARAPVAEVMAAALQGGLSPWQKYFEGSFSEPGWGGRASDLGLIPYLHSDAAFSTVAGRYVLTGYNHGPGRGVWIAFSDDGLRWNFDWIQRGRPDNPSVSPYITIVAPDGSDNALVGDRFFVYWAYNPLWEESLNHGIRYVVRQEVRLVPPGPSGSWAGP